MLLGDFKFVLNAGIFGELGLNFGALLTGLGDELFIF